MSYARFGDDSDVYVYMGRDGLCCCACRRGENRKHLSTDDMINHLREHVAAGDTVPDDVIPDLEADREDNE